MIDTKGSWTNDRPGNGAPGIAIYLRVVYVRLTYWQRLTRALRSFVAALAPTRRVVQTLGTSGILTEWVR